MSVRILLILTPKQTGWRYYLLMVVFFTLMLRALKNFVVFVYLFRIVDHFEIFLPYISIHFGVESAINKKIKLSANCLWFQWH